MKILVTTVENDFFIINDCYKLSHSNEILD